MKTLAAAGEYALRLFEKGDALLLKSARLETLMAMSLGRGGYHFDREAGFEVWHWNDLLADGRNKLFGLYKGNSLAGMTSVAFQGDGKPPVFTGSYLLEEHRGKGLSKLLYEGRLNYVRGQNYAGAETVISRANERSQAAAQGNGFSKTGRILTDGTVEDLTAYRLPREVGFYIYSIPLQKPKEQPALNPKA